MNKKLKHIILLMVFMVCFINFTMAQGEIRGIVVDASNDEPLIGATVIIEGTSIGTNSKLDGTFSLKVPEGNQIIVITFIGYSEKKLEITIKDIVDLGKIMLTSESVGIEEIMIVSSIVRDRQTPVAVSTIKAETIIEKLGTQEFPEVLKSTPSVYSTAAGGGYGDGRINLRGFDSNNIGVLINGVPVNDMENGRVYWSNWAGLADVTQTMQVQRGLGASRLAISSVGGTINIVTRSTDARKGGSVFYSMGNDGYQKQSFTLSTGLYDNGWAITASGSRTIGEGFVMGARFQGWSYFFNVSKKINDNHTLALNAFGAPQWHNQRYTRQLIQTYRDHKHGIRYNPDMGYMNGQIYTSSYNFYHKPQISLSHYWNIQPSTMLSTSAYVSLSSGGGRRIYGDNANWLRFNSSNGLPYSDTKLTPDGYLDFNAVMAANRESISGSQAIIANAINSHDWYGMLSTLIHDIDNLKLTGGLDLRYYKGYHGYQIEDLLGGEYFLNSGNKNRDAGTPLYEGDLVNYHDMGEVSWIGVFGQAEYVTPEYSAFISSSISQTGYRRTDFFSYLDDDPMQQSPWHNFLAYSIKGGANYNISQNHNVFVNGGYFTRAPFMSYVFLNYLNDFNEGVKHERVLSFEVGYGYRSHILSGNLSLYRTNWIDKALTRRIGDVTANISGQNALHQGVELDFIFKPIKELEIKGMLSLGDWVWTDDVIADIYNENQELIGTASVYAGGLHVGDAAQTTAAIGFDYEVLPRFKVGMDFNHYDRLYAFFNIENRTTLSEKGIDAWLMPSYQLLDASLRYDFKMGNQNASVFGKVNNLLDTEVIRDANDGTSHDFDTALVYYGFGRTWSLSLRIRF